MRQLLFTLAMLTVVALAAPHSAEAGFFVSSHRLGAIGGSHCGVPIAPLYAPAYYPYPYAPAVVYAPPLYPRPYFGYYYRGDDDYGHRVVGYTFPGRR